MASLLCDVPPFEFWAENSVFRAGKECAILYEEMQSLSFGLLLYYGNKMNILLR